LKWTLLILWGFQTLATIVLIIYYNASLAISKNVEEDQDRYIVKLENKLKDQKDEK